jgi:hypothetical protein
MSLLAGLKAHMDKTHMDKAHMDKTHMDKIGHRFLSIFPLVESLVSKTQGIPATKARRQKIFSYSFSMTSN